jgi:hypothetical protein
MPECLPFYFPGLERELGGEAHDGAVRGGEHYLQLPVRRLQSGARVHRRLHFPVDALERSQSNAERRAFPQTHGWMGVIFSVHTM